MPVRAELAAATLAGLLLAAPAVPAEPEPDAGFLEFLGLLVEEEGEYLDPLDMAEVEWPEAQPQSRTEDITEDEHETDD